MAVPAQTVIEWLNSITGPASREPDAADAPLFPRLVVRDFAYYAEQIWPLLEEWSEVTGGRLGLIGYAINVFEEGGPFDRAVNESNFGVLDENTMAAVLLCINGEVSANRTRQCELYAADTRPRLFSYVVSTPAFLGGACLDCVAKGRMTQCTRYNQDYMPAGMAAAIATLVRGAPASSLSHARRLRLDRCTEAMRALLGSIVNGNPVHPIP